MKCCCWVEEPNIWLQRWTETFRFGGAWKNVSLLSQMKNFCKLICESFIAELKIYYWKSIFCEKLATFMKHLLRLKRITSGYLFPDLLNWRLNISETKALVENGGLSRHVCFFYVLSLILVEKRKILLLGLHALFCLGWNETKVSITILK